MFRSILFALLLVLSTAAGAEIINCTAKIGFNGVYKVAMDTDTLEMSMVDHGDWVFYGKATHIVSGRTGNDIYFLPTGYGAGLELEVEKYGGRIAFCVEENVCTYCK